MLTRTYRGLTTKEAEAIREKSGFNEVIENELPIWRKVLKKFISPIPLMIEFALILSASIGRWEDFFIILALLIVNLGVESVQSFKANKALSALTKTLALTAEVIRDNKLTKIPARELVPGDVVKLAIGDISPADLELLDDTTVVVDQSTITGESLPVEVNKGDRILSSAIIQKGSAFAKVTATGVNTTIGESVELIAEAEQMEESHFQKAIINIGHFLIILSVALVVIASITLIVRDEPMVDTLRFAIILIIASIPVALPTVLSVTMAIGAAALAKHKAIVSDFTAVEELAGVDQLCIDKTGTLTKNKIEAFSPVLYGICNENDLYTFALLASEEEDHSPIEKALYRYADEHGYGRLHEEYSLVSFTPFDPERKTTEAVVEKRDGSTLHVVMGASQVIAALLSDEQNEDVSAQVDEFATQGFRTISVALKHETDETYTPVGIIPLMDPPRDDSKEVIGDIKEHGITIKMLTGDNHAIAAFIGKQLQIGERVLTATRLQSLLEKKDKESYYEIRHADICSEVVPADKYHIVETLEYNGHIVAMTGDGVNDAPALKKADLGIAVQGATPAAQKAADLVLLDSSLSVIRTAIELARETFSHMQTYALFRISETIRIVVFIALSVIFFEFTPVTAAMIVILALLNDIPVLAISYDNTPKLTKPVRWKMNEMLLVASVMGILGVISSFLLLYFLKVQGIEAAIIMTLIFLKLDLAGHSSLYLTRTGREHFWAKPRPSMKFFIPNFATRFIGMAIAFFGIFMEPISLGAIVLLWIYVTIWFFINDLVKVWLYRAIDRFGIFEKKQSGNQKSPVLS